MLRSPIPGARHGDKVVITDQRSDLYGCIGELRLEPGFETVAVMVGCVWTRMDPDGVRALRAGEKVAVV